MGDRWVIRIQVWILLTLVILLGYRLINLHNRVDSLSKRLDSKEKTPTYRIEVRECVDPWSGGDYRTLDEISGEGN